MDGNWWYAQTVLKKEKHEGHKHGLERMMDLLVVCWAVEVWEVSVFAMSLDNMKREKKEVDTLMSLAKVHFVNLCKSSQIFNKYGIKLRLIGKLEVLPEDVLDSLL